MTDPHAQFASACLRLGVRATDWALFICVASQTLCVLRRLSRRHRLSSGCAGGFPGYLSHARHRISTSRFGVGQESGSNRTPLGLHRVAEKIGGGLPMGTVFKARVPVGHTWDGQPDAAIAHRILWLDGLEPGHNRGGLQDTHARYIYIHGVGDETTLGRPASQGCIHMAAADLLPLHDELPTGSLVWIHEF